MSYSPQTHETVDGDACTILMAPASGVTLNNTICNEENGTIDRQGAAASFCNNRNHRRLAICSIICGISCIGISSLIYSVKAEEARNAGHTRRAVDFTRRAKKFGIISIVTWVAILALTPILMALISYLLTLQD